MVMSDYLQDLSKYYDYIEPICVLIAQKVMDWVDLDNQFSGESVYLIQTSQRILEGLPQSRTNINLSSSQIRKIQPTIEYLKFLDKNLTPFLKGEISGAEIIKQGGPKLWEQWNTENELMGFFNRIVAEEIRNYVNGADILEIGGGVGGTTLIIEEELKNAKSFCFSDIKPYFLEGIKQKLPDLNIATQILDLHNPPETDVLFDLIYATNAIHVSNNVIKSMRWMKNHLSENGIIVLGEGSPYSSKRPWPLEIMFSMFDGWWSVPTFDYRPFPGWLTPEMWYSVFARAGFSNVNSKIYMDKSRLFGGVYILKK